MSDEIAKGDIFVNAENGAWFRVVNVEDTARKGRVVRFKVGTGVRKGMGYAAIAKLTAWRQMSLPAGDFLLKMLSLSVIRKDIPVKP